VVSLVVSIVFGAVALRRLDEESGRRLRQVFYRVRVASQVGILNLHAIEAGRGVAGVVARSRLSAEEEQEIVDWFRERAPSRAGVGPWFGAAEDMNLIMIQVESLQGFVIGLEIEGHEVTPFLNRWSERGLWFSNFGDQTLDGRSSDAEFTTQVSLLPSTGGAAAFLHAGNDFTGLAEILAERGYDTVSAVPFDGSFWNRRTTHQAYGYEQSLFTDDFSNGQQIGWGLNDRDFLHEMAVRLAQIEQPFAAYLLTLSLHHPFEGFPADLKSIDFGRWEGTPFGNFLHTMHFFDQSLAGFVADLEIGGLADNTVIALWGDHDAGFRWRPEIAEVIGYPQNNIGWYLSQEVPFMLAVPGMEASGGERTISTGHTDVAPTLMALLGLDPAAYAFVGRNLLGEPGDFPVIGEFDCWRDSRRLFIRGGGTLEDGQCVDATDLTVLPVSECAAGFAEADRTAVFSAAVLEHDLQREIHLRLTGREISKE
jgi:phosphoglycerol transferase MdoB-like AlkP superfamily enzyme